MRFLLIGCLHGSIPGKLKKRIEKEKFDAVLYSGDLTGSKKMHKLFFKYYPYGLIDFIPRKKLEELTKKEFLLGVKVLKYLNSLKVPIFLVFGNHDYYEESQKRKKDPQLKGITIGNYLKIIKNLKNIIYIHNRRINFNGIKIVGYGGYPMSKVYTTKKLYNQDKRLWKERVKEHKREKKQMLKISKKGIDIFLAHVPPYGVFDRILSRKVKRMYKKKIGIDNYNKVIARDSPKIFVCSHMHEHQGKKKLRKTLVINHGPGFLNKFVIIDIEKERIKKIKFYK